MKQKDKEDLEKAWTILKYYRNKDTGLTGMQEMFEFLQAIDQISIIAINDLIDRVTELEKKLYPPF